MEDIKELEHTIHKLELQLKIARLNKKIREANKDIIAQSPYYQPYVSPAVYGGNAYIPQPTITSTNTYGTGLLHKHVSKEIGDHNI